MKKVISTLLAGAMSLALMLPAMAETTDSVKIYVSAENGNDAAEGTTLNSAVKTPQRAQTLARGELAKGNKVEVVFEAGEYVMDSALTFTSEDNGAIYRAYQGADVKFTTAKKLTADDFESYDGDIKVADLADAKGDLSETVYQLGEMQRIASCTMTGSDFVPVIVKNEVSGYKLPESKAAWAGKQGIKVSYRSGQYTYAIDNFTAVVEDADAMFQLPKRAAEEMEFMNILSELDEPGEYYIDAVAKKLYYYPKYSLEAPVYVSTEGAVTTQSDTVEFHITGGGIVYVDHAENIAFEGIDLFCGAGEGFVISESDNITIYASSITGFGGYGIYSVGATNLKVLASSISDMKKGAIYETSCITAPHRYEGTSVSDQVIPEEQLNLTSSGNIIRNTNISNYGKVQKTSGAAGITINDIGTVIANCEIHDAPFQAICFAGNDHVIENNEIYNVILETWDSGAIYALRSWVGRGTVIRNNFIYTTPNIADYAKITAPYWYNSGTENQAIYIDDMQSGITIEGNVIYNMSQAILIGGGSDNVVKDNLAVNCRSGIHYDGPREKHLNIDNAYAGNTYKEVAALIDWYDNEATAEQKAKWNAYDGFTEMIERVRPYKEIAEYSGSGTDDATPTAVEQTALTAMARITNRTVTGNVYTGPWAEWSVGKFVPEDGANKSNGATWTDSNGTEWKKTSSGYQLNKNGSWVSCPTQFAMATAYDSNDTNANTAMTNAEAGVTIASDGNITRGSINTANWGVNTDSYVPSYSPDEDGVNSGNKYTVVAAVYDENGALKAVNTKKDAFMQDGQMSDIDIAVPEGATGDWQVKLMLWDSLKGLTPIADSNIVLQ